MIFLIYAGMLKYIAYSESGENINKLLEQVPSILKAVLGLGEMDASSMKGFYGILYVYFLLLSGIHAIMLGSVIIAKEERDKTADFLFAKPVLRARVVTFKYLAVLINLIIFNLITLFSSTIFVSMFNKGESINKEIFQFMIAMFIVQLFFASLGSCIASLTSNIKRATSLSTGILLCMFILSVAIDIYDKIDFLKFITPFKYFPASSIVNNGGPDINYVMLSIIISILFSGLTYISISRRDIRV
jgi:ABC-2 type transport system permease protein